MAPFIIHEEKGNNVDGMLFIKTHRPFVLNFVRMEVDSNYILITCTKIVVTTFHTQLNECQASYKLFKLYYII